MYISCTKFKSFIIVFASLSYLFDAANKFIGISSDPKIMGIGPVPAIKEALSVAGMTLDQMDLIEINEGRRK